MKKLMVVACFLGLLSGCAVLDSLVGTPDKPGIVPKVAEPASQSGGLVGIIGSLVLGAANIYQAVRGKQLKGRAELAKGGLKRAVKAVKDLKTSEGVSKADVLKVVEIAILSNSKDPEASKALLEELKKDLVQG